LSSLSSFAGIEKINADPFLGMWLVGLTDDDFQELVNQIPDGVI
jgi:hypothetical protein